MVDLFFDVLTGGVYLFFGVGLVRRSLRQRRIARDPDLRVEADVDVLEAVQDHWLFRSQLDYKVARQMRSELEGHLDLARRDGRSAVDVVGSDLAAFADDWAESHGAEGPWHKVGWSVLSWSALLFSMVMVHRFIDLVGDGQAEIGFAVVLIMALLFGALTAFGVPFMSRVAASPSPKTELSRLVVVVAPTVIAVMAGGALLRWLLLSAGYQFEPQPGRWWVALALIPLAFAVGLWADKRFHDL